MAGIVGASLAIFIACVPAASAVAASSIASLVAEVSQSNIEAHISALEGARATIPQQQAAADYVAAQLGSYGYTVTRDPVSTSENVIASLSGSATPDRVFIVGAHFDTNAASGTPGADDNASGVAGMLELARVLASASFESTIEFVAFGLEEAGLVGSTQYAQAAQAAGRNLIGMVSLEMIAYTCDVPGCQVPSFDDLPCFTVDPEGVDVGNFVATIGNTASSGMVDAFRAAASTHVPLLEMATVVVAGNGECRPGTRWSDHSPFWDAGFEALMITDTAFLRNPNYHQLTDTFETLDLAFATEVTRASLAMVATVAVPTAIPVPTLSPWGFAALGALLVAARTGRGRGKRRSRADP